ncbi:unnamed protein product [marine sediment metagenome]|uniref:Uncharacterized protein n=1 Tax=marine sediment metagenome TaxID=412755 RepID=X1NIR8_9ZZZZ
MADEEEVKEEVVEEKPTEEAEKPSEPNCIVIPDDMKPWYECCQEFKSGKIDDATFFAESLVRTGEFMKKVREKKTGESSE